MITSGKLDAACGGGGYFWTVDAWVFTMNLAHELELFNVKMFPREVLAGTEIPMGGERKV